MFGSLLIIHLFSPKFFMSQPFLYKVRSPGVLQVFLTTPRICFRAQLGAGLTFLGLSSPSSWGYSLHLGPVLKLLFPGVCSCCLSLLSVQAVFLACLPLLPEGTGEAWGEELVTGMGSLGVPGFLSYQISSYLAFKKSSEFHFFCFGGHRFHLCSATGGKVCPVLGKVSALCSSDHLAALWL